MPIVLIGDPKQLDAVTKSDKAIDLGFKTSWFEYLFNLPLYKRSETTGEFNKTYITQLVQNYRSHRSILEIPNKLFYENKLKAMVSTSENYLNYVRKCVLNIYFAFFISIEIINLNVKGLKSENFPIIFKSVQGRCQNPENETRFVKS